MSRGYIEKRRWVGSMPEDPRPADRSQPQQPFVVLIQPSTPPQSSTGVERSGSTLRKTIHQSLEDLVDQRQQDKLKDKKRRGFLTLGRKFTRYGSTGEASDSSSSRSSHSLCTSDGSLRGSRHLTLPDLSFLDYLGCRQVSVVAMETQTQQLHGAVKDSAGAEVNSDRKKKALESTDGNWMLKSEALKRAEEANKNSLHMKNVKLSRELSDARKSEQKSKPKHRHHSSSTEIRTTSQGIQIHADRTNTVYVSQGRPHGQYHSLNKHRGHPHSERIEYPHGHGAPILARDQDGTVYLVSQAPQPVKIQHGYVKKKALSRQSSQSSKSGSPSPSPVVYHRGTGSPHNQAFVFSVQRGRSNSTGNLVLESPPSPLSPPPSPYVIASPQPYYYDGYVQTLPKNFSHRHGQKKQAPTSPPPQNDHVHTMPRNWRSKDKQPAAKVAKGSMVAVTVPGTNKNPGSPRRSTVADGESRRAERPSSDQKYARAHSQSTEEKRLERHGKKASDTMDHIKYIDAEIHVDGIPKSPQNLQVQAAMRRIQQVSLEQVLRENAPRTVVLQKGKNGFGFVLRGAKSQNMDLSTLEFKPTSDFPALQYLDRVDRGSMADRAGLRAGDFLLEINNESVVDATHERTVQLIKQSGDTLAMKVVTVKPLDRNTMNQRDIHADGTRTLPLKKKAAPRPPSRNPQTSLTSQARAEAMSTIESFNVLDRLDQTLSLYDAEPDRQSLGTASDNYVLNKMAASRGIDPNNKTASISRRTKRMSSVPLDGILERQGDLNDSTVSTSASNQQKPVIQGLPRSQTSPDHQSNGGIGHQGAYTPHITRVPVDSPEPVNHSTGHYAEVGHRNVANVRLSTVAYNDNVSYKPGQDERIYAVPHSHHATQDNGSPGTFSVKIVNNNIPAHPRQAPPQPPTHNKKSIPPPPQNPPPHAPHSSEMGEVVQIKTQQQNPYANVSEHIQRQRSGTGTDSDGSYESSFRPGTNARLTKEPLGGPPPPPPSGHSRTSSGTSSLSSSTSAQGEYHPGRFQTTPPQEAYRSSIAVTADVHKNVAPGREFYEPEPDYDKDDGKLRAAPPPADIPSLRSVQTHSRDSTATSEVAMGGDLYKRQITPEKSPAPNPPVTQSNVTSPAPLKVTTTLTSQTKKPAPSPPPKQEQPAMSQFGEAIKMAAEAREKRVKDSPPKVLVKTSSPEHVKTAAPPTPPPPQTTPPPPPLPTQTSSPAIPLPPMNAPPQPPAPPPPPSTLVPETIPTPIVKKPLPPHIQKQLDDQKKREDSHSALLAAVAKRRNIVESANMDNIADHIETRVNRGKKLQTVVYKSDQTKTEVKTAPPPTTLLATTGFDSPAKDNKKESWPEKKEPESKPTTDKPKNNNVPKVTNQNGSVVTPPPAPPNANTDFLASAEKARQDYLQKKAQMTLDRKPNGQAGGADKPVSAKPQTVTSSPQKSLAPKAPLGDLAQLIAQKAAQRQKSTEGVLENHNNNNASSSSYPARQVEASPYSEWSTESSVHLQGATLDFSQTDTPRSSRAPSFSQLNAEEQNQLPVSARKRMFESGKKTVNGGQTPPVIPPPQNFNSVNGANSNKKNNVSSKLGHSNNSSPHKQNGYGTSRLTNGTAQHSNNVAHTVLIEEYPVDSTMRTQLDFIPPPPLFDNEDTASLVSTGSTLSTLSSVDHDSCAHDSLVHSSSAFVPPPPLFDDSPAPDFIPPPIEFDTVVSPGGSTLRNIQKVVHCNSFSYPAVRSSIAPSAGKRGYQDKPIETWSSGDVSDWLDGLQLAEHQARFAKSNINGQMLVTMGRAELIVLGVQQVGHRMTIERSIKKAMIQQSRH